MSAPFWIILLSIVVAVIAGWYLGGKLSHTKKKAIALTHSLTSEYFTGINFLLNEQPDKAVDVFIKMLEANSDTVETHLALGSLFRRRGEVDRAIRIHQNLIARPNLTAEQRAYSLYELGQDYMRAGVLDRAEALFLELVERGEQVDNSLKYLLDIYQQQRDWEHAVAVARKLQAVNGRKMEPVIAHFYCELAEGAMNAGLFDKAGRYLKQALANDSECTRAYIQQAEIYKAIGKEKAAINSYKRVLDKSPHYLLEVLDAMILCYEHQGSESAFTEYFQKYIKKHPLIPVLNGLLFAKIRHYYGDVKSSEFIVQQLEKTPTIQGVKSFIELQLGASQKPNESEKWELLHELIEKLLDKMATYQCSHCGFSSQVLYWHCPSCKHWDTMTLVTGFQSEHLPAALAG